jgi:hypothetical protein
MTSSTGRFTRDRPVRESRKLVNMRNQPHGDNGEGVAMPRPYPLIFKSGSKQALVVFVSRERNHNLQKLRRGACNTETLVEPGSKFPRSVWGQ